MTYEIRSDVVLLHPCGNPPPEEVRYFIFDGEGCQLPFRFRTKQQAEAFICQPALIQNRLQAIELLEREIEEIKTLQRQLVDRERNLGYLQNILTFPFGYDDFIREEGSE